ncbi:MAG: M18 family aminopeptidase [Clostridia bacterium]|nr:M18 family aminopeptidase [Clostridia bacterium]
MKNLSEFLQNSLTAYHACDNVKAALAEHGFVQLHETADWNVSEGGKYYIVRGGSIIAFTIDSLDDFSYKIVASHPDSPALKVKENAVKNGELYTTLNTETYGGGIWYSFFDRPLKIAGRVITKNGSVLESKTVTSPFTVTIPSLAIHQNRNVNDGFSVNKQVDLQPLVGLKSAGLTMENLVKNVAGDEVISHDLYLVNADMPYTFGVNDEFLAAPRIDNLTSVYSSLQAFLSHEEKSGICVLACMNNEEVGSLSAQGADGDFLETTLRRIAYAFRFDDNEFYKALASSFLLSADNAHALHPNHPEVSDPTNKAALGGGVVIKSHAGGAYITDAMSSAIVKTVLESADVPYQHFLNNSSQRSGSTLGCVAMRHLGLQGADIGIAQLAMHSANECCALVDCEYIEKGMRAFFETTLRAVDGGIIIER